MRDTVLQQKLVTAGRWLCYTLLLVICYVLQTTRGLFEIDGIRPLWLAAACLVVCGFEDAFPSALYGMFAGLLCDLSGNRLVGFYAGCLLVCCFICSCIIQLALRRTVINVCLLGFVCVFTITGLDYLFTYILFSLPQSSSYFFSRLLPTIIYTAVVSVPLYPLCGLISRIGRQND